MGPLRASFSSVQSQSKRNKNTKNIRKFKDSLSNGLLNFERKIDEEGTGKLLKTEEKFSKKSL